MSSVGAHENCSKQDGGVFVDAGRLAITKYWGVEKNKFKWNDLGRVGRRNRSEDRTRTGQETREGRVKIGGFGIFAPFE